MKTSVLPEDLRFRACSDLIRLGVQSDGGYLVSEADVSRSKLLLGFGINTDWTFEMDFHRRNPVPIIAYDASTNFQLFVKHSLIALSQREIGKALVTPFRYRSLRRFFSEPNVLHGKFVGLGAGGGRVSMQEVMEGLDQTDVFVKMDIEGSEYRCLDDLLAHQHLISAFVVEFHDVDLHIDRIIDFVRAFELDIAHIHANNHSPLTGDGLPLVLEITFSRHGAFTDDEPVLPHQLDRACNLGDDEIAIGFA
jgi:hypothetical protein